MLKRAKLFLLNENGNAGIDWIVLTSGIVTLGMAVGIAISTPVSQTANDINTAMAAMEPAQP